MAKETKKHMSQQDIEDWNLLYEYVRKNVLNYDDNQSLSRNMVLRLRGLLNNKFMANNNIADTSNYSYKTVLNTFKFCNSNIQKSLRENNFKDENHKFNYILKIVESNLNTVYLKMRNVEKTKVETENHDVSYAASYVNTFNPKEEKRDNSQKYKDLW